MVQTYYVNGDVADANSLNWALASLANDVEYYYNADGSVGSIVETIATNGSTVTTEFWYNGSSQVGSIVETRNADSITITTEYYYNGSGVIGSFTRTVV